MTSDLDFIHFRSLKRKRRTHKLRTVSAQKRQRRLSTTVVVMTEVLQSKPDGVYQSCLHRWLTAVEWDVHTLNDRRLAWLQQAPQTRYSVSGVIAIDNTLVDHEGN